MTIGDLDQFCTGALNDHAAADDDYDDDDDNLLV